MAGWFMMRVGMIPAWSGYPVNGWPVTSGIKEAL